MIAAVRNAYDYRLKQAIVETGNLDLVPELAIPASTRRTWIRRGVADVVSFDKSDADFHALRATIGRLNKRVAILAAVVRLLVTLVRVTGPSLERTRVAATVPNNRILKAVAGAEPIVGRHAVRLREHRHRYRR